MARAENQRRAEADGKAARDEGRIRVMQEWVSRYLSDEPAETRHLWFQSLTMEQRGAVFMEAFRIVVERDPGIIQRQDTGPPRPGVQVLDLTMVNRRSGAGFPASDEIENSGQAGKPPPPVA